MKPKIKSMTTKVDKIAEKLNIEDIQHIELKPVPQVESQQPENNYIDLANDYSLLRQKIQHILTRSEEILDEATKTVKVMPNAINISAFSELVKSISDSSKMLLEVHKEIINIQEKQLKIAQIKQEMSQENNQKSETLTSSTLKEILKIVKEG